MPTVNFTHGLSDEFSSLFTSWEIRPEKFDVIGEIVDKMMANKSRYEAGQRQVGIPWYFLAAIHNMENSMRFNRHLHNGDPLTKRTRHVPAGRPVKGVPPFNWEESAIDALLLKKLDRIEDWSLLRILYETENYKGWGYRLYHPEVLSPYLWSFSNHHKKGKYVADGTWSHTATSGQCGAVVLIRRLEQRGEITLSKQSRRKVFFRYSPRSDH